MSKTKAISSLLIGLSMVGALNANAASDIVLSKKIKKDLQTKINRDLNLLDSFKFAKEADPATLKLMGLSSLNAATASDWLNQRVSYIIEENAFSIFNLLIKKSVYVERKNVQYPDADIIPYSMSAEIFQDIDNYVIDHEATVTDADGGGMTVMSNVGAALYLGGKQKEVQYGLKVSRGFLRPSTKVDITSPRTGIIQIGEGLFAPGLTINKENPDALANSIFRLGTFFHEARHSDGHGKSLGFTHATCPKGHDYEGAPACDDNLNGPYTVGEHMMAEMSKACTDTNCSARDKELLKLMVIDSASRILTTTSKGEKATWWDDAPESL